jgi:hypothetical protein
MMTELQKSRLTFLSKYAHHLDRDSIVLDGEKKKKKKKKKKKEDVTS